VQAQCKPRENPADSLIPDSLIPDSLIPDSLIPDSLIPDSLIPDSHETPSLKPKDKTPCPTEVGPEEKKSEKIFPEDSEPYRLASLLHDLIKENDPKSKEPNIQRWALEIDRLIRLDGREPEEIETVLRWSQADPFWKTNILSATKLRKQFQQLKLKMGGKKHGYDFSDKEYTGTPIDEIEWLREGSSNPGE
jgi:hypothetical protein